MGKKALLRVTFKCSALWYVCQDLLQYHGLFHTARVIVSIKKWSTTQRTSDQRQVREYQQLTGKKPRKQGDISQYKQQTYQCVRIKGWSARSQKG